MYQSHSQTKTWLTKAFVSSSHVTPDWALGYTALNSKENCTSVTRCSVNLGFKWRPFLFAFIPLQRLHYNPSCSNNRIQRRIGCGMIWKWTISSECKHIKSHSQNKVLADIKIAWLGIKDFATWDKVTSNHIGLVELDASDLFVILK